MPLLCHFSVAIYGDNLYRGLDHGARENRLMITSEFVHFLVSHFAFLCPGARIVSADMLFISLILS